MAAAEADPQIAAEDINKRVGATFCNDFALRSAIWESRKQTPVPNSPRRAGFGQETVEPIRQH
jgi:hypothetical protein